MRRLAVATVTVMYIVLVMGALVTNTDSSQGCGASWPLCNGSVFPIANFHTMVEYSHRIVVTLATVLVLALAIAAWRRPGPGNRNRWFGALAVAGLFAEAGVGGASVIWPQPTALLATHFGLSLLSYAGVFLLALSVPKVDAEPPTAVNVTTSASGTTTSSPETPSPAGANEPAGNTDAPDGSTARMGSAVADAGARTGTAIVGRLAHLTTFTWILLLYTVALIYSGAYVRHSGSFCGQWPLCEGGLIPPLHSAQFPQFAHRLLAGLLLVGLVALWRMAAGVKKERPDLAKAAGWAVAFAVMQVLAGLVVVLTDMSVLAAMLHAAIIPLLFSAELYLALELGVLGRRDRSATAQAQGALSSPIPHSSGH